MLRNDKLREVAVLRIQGYNVPEIAEKLSIGLRAVEKPVHFRDLHATIINQLGLNQDALSYMHQGRKERLTEVHGEILKEIIA